MSDSGNAPEASRSPATPQYSPRPLSNERNRDSHHSLFGSDDDDQGGEFYSSPPPARASSHERDDDGASRRQSGSRGTDKGTTVKRDELKPWRLPEQLINSLSHETGQHHRIPLFDATELHGLVPARRIFALKKTFISMSFLDIDGTTATKSVTKHRFWLRGTRSSKV